MNKKGFTLVELLAVIVIMGILALIAVPAFTRILERGKTQQYITDAKEMISKAKYQFKMDGIELNSDSCKEYSLDVIDITNDFDPYWNKDDDSSEIHKYNSNSSVKVCNISGTYKYSVRLYSEYSALNNENFVSEADIDNCHITKKE